MPSAEDKPKRKRPPRERVFGWAPLALWGFMAEARGKRIVAVVGGNPGDYGVVALEYDAAAEHSPEALFAAHSHKAIGSFADLPVAMREAESYVRRWFLAEPLDSKPCDCGEIGAAFEDTQTALQSAAGVVTK